MVALPDNCQRDLWGASGETGLHGRFLVFCKWFCWDNFLGNRTKISRRDFLKLIGVNLAGMALGTFPGDFSRDSFLWPTIKLRHLPENIQSILSCVPETYIAPNGYLHLQNQRSHTFGRVPLAETQWNLERNQAHDELFPDLPWGLVLHWYGDPDYFDRSVKGYLRGFNGVRKIDDYETQTSAHFLIGDGFPSRRITKDDALSGIIQTQAPSPSGVPYLASHLNNFIVRDFDGDHYFVNTLYKLGLAEANINPVLKDIFEGPKIDPNFRTISVEIAGFDFDNSENCPSDQKIANTLSVVWAVMKRYGIRAGDVLGHHEIQLDNADPGKKFMAMMRYLVGIKALLEDDARMKYLVFGQFIENDCDLKNAVKRYFKFVRDYLVLVSLPIQVYEWEAWSKYWQVFDRISESWAFNANLSEACFPIQSANTNLGNLFLDPKNHEGIDIYLADDANRMVNLPGSAHLVSQGVCMFIGENNGFHHGKMAAFRHREKDGAEVLTLYGHLQEIGNLRIGKTYPPGYQIGNVGQIGDGMHTFLHFSTAYGATWDLHLSRNPNVPLSADEKWIQRHFLHPEEFLNNLVHRPT